MKFGGNLNLKGISFFLLTLQHRIRIHRRATRVGAFEVFEAAHVALRTLLAFSQPVNCIFWPVGMLNWLVAASKLHKYRETCCTAEWPFYSFLILCPAVCRSLSCKNFNSFDKPNPVKLTGTHGAVHTFS